MDVEGFIISIRERRPVWDQQLADHHNRYVLGRLWKEIGQENNCSVKEAQKKWKGLRDYYRSEFRKTQKERSGQGTGTTYKPNWPFFTTMDFLRQQFQARPSSGNISCKHSAKKRKADPHGITEFTNNDLDSPDNEQDNRTDEPLIENIPEDIAATASTSAVQDSTLTHPDDLTKKKIRQHHIQRLVQIEEKTNQAKELEKKTDDEDAMFFESLKPHLKLITGMNKLMFRNEVQDLVMKYAYFNREVNCSSRSTTVSESEPIHCESPSILFTSK